LHAPAGAALERYEAWTMLMIASRVLEAYDGADPPDDQPRRGRKPRDS